ncbi:MAG TPA: metallophosphoesterase [Candidatus Cybelea sp.]|nr:metallophosphoesterase [Candidatus Cybelea sp.]
MLTSLVFFARPVLAAALAWLCIAPAVAASSAAAPRAEVWLALSDIHLDLFDDSPDPNSYGLDANPALLHSALARMKRAEPNPAVVLLPGDFLMHDFALHLGANDGSPNDAALRSMRWIAAMLGRAFPKAQFAIAAGNNDVPCGDYRSANGSAYLRSVASIWAPLVNRHGAAPGFAASFARAGHYTASLPVHGLRLVVLNTVLFSSQYRGNCGAGDARAPSAELSWLNATLRTTPSGTRNVVMMHVPPGFDAFSTEYVRGFLAWPYLKPRYTNELVGALASPENRVVYAIAGHAHRFDFRLAGDVPIVVLGSLSPLFDNNPAFYALKIAPDGSLGDVDLYALDGRSAAWMPPRSFDRTWGVRSLDGASLALLHARLAQEPEMRRQWDLQNIGWAPDRATLRGTWERDSWRVAWCAQRLPIANFAECAGIGNRVRILPVLLAAAAAAVMLLIVLAVVRARARR